MAETAAVDPQAPEDALAEPTRNVSWVFLLSITLANLGIMMVLITPLNNLLPRYTQAITGGDGKEAALAVVSGVGAIAAMVFNPLAGALSDRTTARIGRRRPWVIGGALTAAALMVVMSYQSSILGLTILWFLVLAAANMAFSALIRAPTLGDVGMHGIGVRRVGFDIDLQGVDAEAGKQLLP